MELHAAEPDKAKKERRSVQLGISLQGLREARTLGQRELGERTGILLNRISRIENGHIEPRVLELVALAQALDVSLDRLVYGHDPKRGRLPSLLEELERRADRKVLAVVEEMLGGLLRSEAAPSDGKELVATMRISL